MARMLRVPARAQILLAALLISTAGTVIKALTLTNWQIASLRSGIAVVVLAIGVGRLRGFSRSTLVVGVAYATMMITFVSANKLTTAANTVFLQGTAPLYIALLGPWILKEHVRRRDMPVLAAIACGMLLLFAGSASPSATAPNRALGNAVGAVSGFCWCLTVIGLRWVEKRAPSARGDAAGAAAITGNVIVCLACLPLAWPISHTAVPDLGGVAYLGVFQVGLAFLLLTRAIQHVPAVDASLLLLVEPALSPVWAWIVHREAPGFWPLMGGALIISASAWKTWRDAGAR
jgi:drug/metabolite transporter (DMT)-like permease